MRYSEALFTQLVRQCVEDEQLMTKVFDQVRASFSRLMFHGGGGEGDTDEIGEFLMVDFLMVP